MRKSIDLAVCAFLDSLPRIGEIPIPGPLHEKLAQLSDFTAKARSHVTRDRNGDVQYLPRPEVGTRLSKELGKLLLALSAVRAKAVPDERDFDTVSRVAEDCLPPNRLAVIQALRHNRQPMTLAQVERATGLPRKTALRVLDDLRVLGLVEVAGNHTWGFANEWK